MFAKIVICVLITKAVIAQLDGNFWWLNDKLAKYVAEPVPPKFEELNEFDTDESAKIVFQDNNLFSNSEKKPKSINKGLTGKESEKSENYIHFQDRSEIVWPDSVKYTQESTYKNIPKKETNQHAIGNKKDETTQKSSGDVFDFKFPENDNYIWDTQINDHSHVSNKNSTKSKTSSKVTIVNNKIPVKAKPESENICTFMKKTKCNRIKGVVSTEVDSVLKHPQFDTHLICCILPITTDELSKIYFRKTSIKNKNKRYRRSNKEEGSALKQRNFLLTQKYLSYAQQKPKTTVNTRVTHKIVTDDDDDGYVDPYSNIKNSNFKTPNPQNNPYQQTNTNYEYDGQDYVEDYVEETPKPGLVGLYSDHGTSGPYWSFVNGNTGTSYGGVVDAEEEDSGSSFGYGAFVDPRLEDRLSTVKSKPLRARRPLKLSTASSNELSYDAESQIIGYQSNPDFKVLQGFKLPNLVRNKSRIYKNGRKTSTTERVFDHSKESVLLGTSSEEDYAAYESQQVYKECGKTLTESVEDYDRDTSRQIGEAEKGSHPWLALVVLTRRRQSVLCYATLVNTRAAVTAADCVHGRTSPGEISLVAGAWNLNEESREGWQRRMASARLHPQYSPEDLANNLAILYWKRSLKFNANVQPACLADPHVGDDCKFFGWGGYDQAIRPHSRWQRASILAPRECRQRLSSQKRSALPDDTFCATVHSRGTVTGIGGPLMCQISGRHSAVGVAVWRDNALLMVPVQEWTTQAISATHLY